MIFVTPNKSMVGGVMLSRDSRFPSVTDYSPVGLKFNFRIV